MKVATMNSSQTSHVSKGTGAARTWTPDDLPHVQQAAQQIERPTATLAQLDARIAQVANDLAQQQSRFAALQKDSADSLQKSVEDSLHVDPNEPERDAETAALQPAMHKTSALLTALKTARAASPAVEELANAEQAYLSACGAARLEREAMHRERLEERLAASLFQSYEEMLSERFIGQNPFQKDPMVSVAELFERATRERKVICRLIGRVSRLHGDASSSSR